MTKLFFLPTVNEMKDLTESNQHSECYLLGCQLLKEQLGDTDEDMKEQLETLEGDFQRIIKLRDANLGMDHHLSIERQAAYEKLKKLGKAVLVEQKYSAFHMAM
jgi:hypothetical protein